MVIQEKVNNILLLNMLMLRSDSDLFSLSYIYSYREPVPNILTTNETPLPSTVNKITHFHFHDVNRVDFLPMPVEGSCILKAFATHGTSDGNVQMLLHVHQHTIFICMLKFT